MQAEALSKCTDKTYKKVPMNPAAPSTSPSGHISVISLGKTMFHRTFYFSFLLVSTEQFIFSFNKKAMSAFIFQICSVISLCSKALFKSY